MKLPRQLAALGFLPGYPRPWRLRSLLVPLASYSLAAVALVALWWPMDHLSRLVMVRRLLDSAGVLMLARMAVLEHRVWRSRRSLSLLERAGKEAVGAAEIRNLLNRALAEALWVRDPALLARVLYEFCDQARLQGRLAEAEGHARQILPLIEIVHGRAHKRCAEMLNNIACLCEEQERYSDAQKAFQEALTRWRELGVSQPEYALTLRNLGHLHLRRGDCMAAQDALEQALRLQELAPAPADELAITRRLMAHCCQAQGRIQEAEELFHRARRAAELAYGSRHASVGGIQRDLAGVCAAQGRIEEAEHWYRLALATIKGSVGLHSDDGEILLDHYARFLEISHQDLPAGPAQC